MKFRALLIALFLWSIPAFADGSFSHNFRTSGTVGSVNLLNAGISYHELSWTKTGTVSACSVEVDSSTDGITWSAGGVIGSQDCTSSGHSTVANSVVNFIRLHMVSFTGSGSVVVTWTGTVTNPAAIPDGLDSHRFLKTGTGKPINLVHTGVAYHKLTWNVQGTVSACSAELDSSSDAKTWSAGGVISGQDCTSNGASSIVNSAVNYVRLNMATFTGTGSVNVTWAGWVTNPSGGITSLSYSPSDSTIVASWTTPVSANSNITCGGKAGIDNGIAPNGTSHLGIVTGLSPSTPYSCTVTSGAVTSSPQTVSTLSAAVRTPITAAIFSGTPTQIAGGNSGDDLSNFQSSDGHTYIVQDDGSGFDPAGPNAGANMQIDVLTNNSTLAGTQVNLLTNYGPQGGFNGSDGPGGVMLSNKQTGLFGEAGSLFIFQNRSCVPDTCPQFQEFYGNIMQSQDHGVTWNSWQATGTYNANGVPPSPLGSFQFANGNIGSVMPVRYAADNGTIGYLTTGNRIDGADGWVYLLYQDDVLQNGTNTYLARVSRANLLYSNGGSAFQYWIGPASPTPANFVDDTNWSSSPASETSIYTSATQVSNDEIDFIPAYNEYVLLNWFYDGGTMPMIGSSFWDVLVGPTPAGPWTLANETRVAQFVADPVADVGYYMPKMIHPSLLAVNSTGPHTIEIVYTGRYDSGPTFYQPTHSLVNISDTTTSYSFGTPEDPLSDGGNFSTLPGVAHIKAVAGGFSEPSSTGANSVAAYTAGTWPDDQFTTIKIDTISGTAYAGPGVRMDAAGSNGYVVCCNALFKLSGGGFTQILGSLPNAASGDTWTVYAMGNLLTVARNGIVVGAVTDTTFPHGTPGLYQFETGASGSLVSNFSAGDLP